MLIELALKDSCEKVSYSSNQIREGIGLIATEKGLKVTMNL